MTVGVTARGLRGLSAQSLREWLPAVIVFVVVLIVWEVSLLAFGIQSFLIPRPSVIAASLVSEWSTLAKGIAFTGTEAVGGLIVGVALGTLSGLATARWATARELLLPVAIGASAIPIIAFAPITLNWFGPESILPRLTIVALMVFFPVMINTIRGLTNVEPAALELLSSYAASDRQTLAKLRAPNALPYWFTALADRHDAERHRRGRGRVLRRAALFARDLHHARIRPQPVPDGVGCDRRRVRDGDRAVSRRGGARAARHALGVGSRDGAMTMAGFAYHQALGGQGRPPSAGRRGSEEEEGSR